MEVKHPHHVTHKKKWTEYLLEFFMLFLAVFLGFLAENAREHIAEKSKEKEYIKSLVSDLKSDTTNINRGIKGLFMQAKKMDTLQSMLSLKEKNDSIVKKLYKLGFYVANDFSITFNQRTTNQLISSGNMRLLKPNVSDSIVNYTETIKVMQEQATIYLNAIMKCIENRYDVFDIAYIKYKISNDTIVGLNNSDWKNIQLATTDPQVLKRYEATVETAKVLGETYLFMLRKMKGESAHLLSFLQKEYRFENE